jgi:5-methylcytosine-specific restriction protein A
MMSIDRKSEVAASSTLEEFIPESNVRRTCLKFLADSIRRAHKSHPNRWGVTLSPAFVRLNIGKPEALSIYPGFFHVVLDLYSLPKTLMPHRNRQTIQGRLMRWNVKGLYLWGHKSNLELGVYSSVPGSIICNINDEMCRSWLPIVRLSHDAFIEKASMTARNPRTKIGHSPGIISFLSRYLKQNIPQPKYFNPLTEDELQTESLSEEAVEPKKYYEGNVQEIPISVYERNPKARKKCLEHYGVNCYICGFNFEDKYGAPGKGFIHVHHLKPLSEIKEQYELDPIKDLRPVCPNCHAMIHRSSTPNSINDVKRMLKN